MSFIRNLLKIKFANILSFIVVYNHMNIWKIIFANYYII